MLNKNGIIFVLVLTAGLSAGAGLVEMTASYISLDQVGNMAIANLIAEPGYTYTFGSGARGISDGSEFDAVRRAFGTWIAEPASAVWALEENTGGGLTPGVRNRRNDVSWISPTAQNPDPWSGLLGLSEKIISAVFIWYDALTGGILERDLYFNDVNMSWRTGTDGPEEGGFFVEHIALHEIGHIFGLRDVYDPGQPGWEEWMGFGNEDLTMYGYAGWRDEDVTLSAIDIAAMAALHPASVPEPRSLSLFGLAAGIVLIFKP